jgi:hypothetical protein
MAHVHTVAEIDAPGAGRGTDAATETGIVSRSILSEGLAIAALPVAAYGFALTYEISFLKYFGIDSQLAHVERFHLLVAVTNCFAIGFAVFQTALVVAMARPKRLSPVLKELLPLLIVVAIAALLALLFGNDLRKTSLALLFFSPVVLQSAFVLGEAVVIKRRDPHRRFSAVVRWGRRWQKNDAYSTAFKVVSKWFGKGLYIILIVLLGMTLAIGLGRRAAATQREFMCIRGGQNLIVVRAYAEYWICIPADAANTPTTDDYLLVAPGDLRDRPISLQKVSADWSGRAKRRDP